MRISLKQERAEIDFTDEKPQTSGRESFFLAKRTSNERHNVVGLVCYTLGKVADVAS